MSFSEKNSAFHLYPVLLVLLIVVMLATSSPAQAQKKGSGITVGTVGVFVYAALAWKRRFRGLFGRPHYSLAALSKLGFVALLGYYNLLGFQF